VLDVHGAGEQDRLGQILRRGALGMDHEVDPQHAARLRLVGLEVVVVAHAGHRPPGAHLVADQGGDDVGLVALGHAAEQVGVGGADLGEHLRRGAVARHDERVEVAAQGLEPPLVLIDDGDVVALAAERPRDVLAHVAGADDDHAHGSALRSGASTAGVVPRLAGIDDRM
jgi:hypothetical protein